MATAIGIMGESGSGKTTSARTLDPQSTYYIDCDKKGLSWRGWKSQYNSEKKNYYCGSDVMNVWKIISGISDKRQNISTIIVDTVNGIMIDDEMKRMKEKGYDKWQDLAISVYGLISNASMLRDDLTICYLFHVQDLMDDNGNHSYRILTSGRKLEKIKLESKLTTVLLAKCVDGKYMFETQSKNSTAKSPMDMFDSFEIENDLNYVVESHKKFNAGE